MHKQSTTYANGIHMITCDVNLCLYSPPTQQRAQRRATPKRQQLRFVVSCWLNLPRWMICVHKNGFDGRIVAAKERFVCSLACNTKDILSCISNNVLFLHESYDGMKATRQKISAIVSNSFPISCLPHSYTGHVALLRSKLQIVSIISYLFNVTGI